MVVTESLIGRQDQVDRLHGRDIQGLAMQRRIVSATGVELDGLQALVIGMQLHAQSSRSEMEFDFLAPVTQERLRSDDEHGTP